MHGKAATMATKKAAKRRTKRREKYADGADRNGAEAVFGLARLGRTSDLIRRLLMLDAKDLEAGGKFHEAYARGRSAGFIDLLFAPMPRIARKGKAAKCAP